MQKIPLVQQLRHALTRLFNDSCGIDYNHVFPFSPILNMSLAVPVHHLEGYVGNTEGLLGRRSIDAHGGWFGGQNCLKIRSFLTKKVKTSELIELATWYEQFWNPEINVQVMPSIPVLVHNVLTENFTGTHIPVWHSEWTICGHSNILCNTCSYGQKLDQHFPK